MKNKNNQFVVWTSAFTLGFCMVILANFVFANTVDSIDDNPENGASVYPVLNEVTIGSNTHNVVMTHDGQMNIDVIPGTDKYAIDITSNKGGVNISSVHDALLGKNKVNSGGTYGRFGVKNIFNTMSLIFVGPNNTAMSFPVSIHSYIGYLASLDPNFDPITSDTTTPIFGNASKPYAFYTPNGDTYLGDDVESNGEIINPLTQIVDLGNGTSTTVNHPVNILSNVNIDTTHDRDLEIDGDLYVKTMEFSDPDVIREKFGVITATTWSMKPAGPNDVEFSPGDTFSAQATCPATTYIVGCSGDISDSKYNAVYKGAYALEFGNSCKAIARKPVTSSDTNFHLNAYAYCFNPQSNNVTWSQD